MGCLNSEGQFKHWFGNIHLSGPCNRSCYLCIGQHMMALDRFNNLETWPLDNLDGFIAACRTHDVHEVNVTGSNTDPLLYRHTSELAARLREALPSLRLGIRTNGALVLSRPDIWALYDKASLSVTSLNPARYRRTMGQGHPPDIHAILALDPSKPVKINIVLCPEITTPRSTLSLTTDLLRTIERLAFLGITKINLREPYGQPHQGNPFEAREPDGHVFGMPLYRCWDVEVVYWDVHYVEVESVNLYANGRVSETYPVTKGHTPDGRVDAQAHFPVSGRQVKQWVHLGA